MKFNISGEMRLLNLIQMFMNGDLFWRQNALLHMAFG